MSFIDFCRYIQSSNMFRIRSLSLLVFLLSSLYTTKHLVEFSVHHLINTISGFLFNFVSMDEDYAFYLAYGLVIFHISWG